MIERITDLLSGGQMSAMAEEVERLGRMNESLSLQMEEFESMKESSVGDDWSRRLDIDQGWVTVSGASSGLSTHINKRTVDLYADLAAFMYIYNPLIKRAVDIKTLFTFSRSFQVKTLSDSSMNEVETIRKDLLNKQAFFSQKAIQEVDAELQKSGNIFIAVWKDVPTPQVRVWPSSEMSDIILDENDSSRPTYYVRAWTNNRGVTSTVAYPSVFNDQADNFIEVNGQMYDVDNSISVYHMSCRKGIKQKWALSELSAAMRWAKAHEGFLEDFAAIVRALRKYTHMFATKGGPAQVSALQGQFQGDVSNMGNPLQSNPAGSMIVASEGNDMKVVDAGAGKIVGAKDSRYFLIMVCAGTGIPETLLTGDPSTGNLATAKELTGPFITQIESRQEDWKDAISMVFRAAMGDADVEISFPPVRSQDALDYVNTLISASTLNSPGNYKGTISAEALISGLYEALDIDIAEDEKESLVAGFLETIAAGGDDDMELAGAVEHMIAMVREMQRG